jgi:hypothetical protein
VKPRDFLSFPTGDLPRPWVLDATHGVFRQGRGNRTGFCVKLGG